MNFAVKWNFVTFIEIESAPIPSHTSHQIREKSWLIQDKGTRYLSCVLPSSHREVTLFMSGSRRSRAKPSEWTHGMARFENTGVR